MNKFLAYIVFKILLSIQEEGIKYFACINKCYKELLEKVLSFGRGTVSVCQLLNPYHALSASTTQGGKKGDMLKGRDAGCYFKGPSLLKEKSLHLQRPYSGHSACLPDPLKDATKIKMPKF